MDITENWSIYVGDDELAIHHKHSEQNHTMRERTVQIDNGKTITFTGKELGYTTWQLSEATENRINLYASLYITEQSNYICELEINQFDDGNIVATGAVCKTHNEIVEFFGLTYQFKLFYRQLKLDKSAYEIHVL